MFIDGCVLLRVASTVCFFAISVLAIIASVAIVRLLRRFQELQSQITGSEAPSEAETLEKELVEKATEVLKRLHDVKWLEEKKLGQSKEYDPSNEFPGTVDFGLLKLQHDLQLEQARFDFQLTCRKKSKSLNWEAELNKYIDKI